MKYNRIPGTRIDASPICLGTMTFGNPVEPDDAIRLIHWALDNGINFIDTADMYEGYDRKKGSSGAVAENIIGEALKDRRDKAIVTTKVGNSIGDSEYQGQGLSRAHMMHQVKASLSRMQTDYIDFYQLHCPDPETPLAESISVMDELIKAGMVRHWGVSNYSADQIRGIIQICDENHWARPVINQPPMSWLKRDHLTSSLAVCLDFNMAVTPYQPLQGGLLTGKYKQGLPLPVASRADESNWLEQPDDDLFDQLEQFEAEAKAMNLKPAQYAVRWLLDQQGISSVIVGVKRIEQLEEVLQGINL